MKDKCYHLGHLILDCFRQRPDVICEIDAATGESQTNRTVLSRSVQLANCLRTLGLVPGDVVALSGRNHLDLHIPYYAALFNGLPLLGVDQLYKFAEIKSTLQLGRPKIAFCEEKDYENYVRATSELGLNTRIVSFGNGKHSLSAFVREHQTDEKEEDFEAAVFEPREVYVWLISTSGTTGFPKVAAITYSAFYEKTIAYTSLIKSKGISNENKPALNMSPIQWVSGIFNPVGMPLLGQTMVQTSAPPTEDHIIDVINQYKPQQMLAGPTLIWYILNSEKKCDLSCFDSIILGGAKCPVKLITQLRSQMRPGTMAVEMYGQTETLGPALAPNAATPPNSCGSPTPLYQIKLADPETGIEITDPDMQGEMLVKGNIFTEYYNNPSETKAAFTEDGWFKTGDLFYRDENNNYFYVAKLKALIKYKSYHVIPAEIEEVIRSQPEVFDVAVAGAPHPCDGEWPVACVVLKEGATITTEQIQDLVRKNLSEKKQLRGGVIFLSALPRTSSGKISMKEVKNIVSTTIKL